MNPYKSTLERAFEMANAGKCETVASVIKGLNKEGYNGNQVNGRALVKHLSTLIAEAKQKRAPHEVFDTVNYRIAHALGAHPDLGTVHLRRRQLCMKYPSNLRGVERRGNA